MHLIRTQTEPGAMPKGVQVRLYGGLAADERGSDDGRSPLVLLHGLTFDRSMWRPALAGLAGLDPRRRVVSFDLPGHGDSADGDSYRPEDVAEVVHRAVEEAGLSAPVMVGHSISAAIAGIYAATHPTSGVVNVDASLLVEPFAELVQSLEPRLAGAGFDEVWETVFWPSMHVGVLPLGVQELLRTTSRARQAVVLGYWRDLLDRTPGEVAGWVADGLATLRERSVPYLLVTGDELEESYRRWLARQLPQATVTVLPGSGHFPQLAHPRLFAECLEAFAGWSHAWSYVA